MFEPASDATALQRIAAFAIDWCVFAVWGGTVFGITWWIQDGEPRWFTDPWLAQLAGAALTTLPFGIYLFATEASQGAATLGKRALGLRVVAVDGGRPSRRGVLLRTVGKLLPWELGHLLAWQLMATPPEAPAPPWSWVVAGASLGGAAWYALSLAMPSRRTPYDRLSGTRVVAG